MAQQLLDPDQALALVIDHTPPPQAVWVEAEHTLGARLLEPAIARVDQPPFDKAMMDGFAVRVADAGRRVKRVGEVAAGQCSRQEQVPGQAVDIMTGAPCPPGTEAVVKVEDVLGEGGQIGLPSPLHQGQHIQKRGTICKKGDEVLPAGTLITSVSLGTASAVGLDKLKVAKKPSLAVVTTGNELGRPGAPLVEAQVYDSNGPMLAAEARRAGAGECGFFHARDDEQNLALVFDKTRSFDIVVFSGGVSMGRYDLVPKVMQNLGADVIFHRVSQKPGKPMLFASRGKQLLFGLPGTPLGSHFTFFRYVGGALRKACGHPPSPSVFRGALKGSADNNGARTLFLLALATVTDQGWEVETLPWRGSSDTVSAGRANCYLRVEPSERIAPGDGVSFQFFSSGVPT